MGWFVIGLIVGAMGAAAIYTLDLSALTLLPPLVAILGGLVIGALSGWRNPRPGGALISGMLAGGLAGVLLVAGHFAGMARVVHMAGAPVWMRDISQYSPTYGWLTRGMGGLLVLLTTLIGGGFAGMLSAWTGFRAPSRPWIPSPEDTMSILPNPFEPEPESE
ncbi:MAG TPA: hypothetical protein VFQ25_09925 [Ktedonobacterales bacterium]|nr:hypothetical protein [Ktedonobacterales bacterium]